MIQIDTTVVPMTKTVSNSMAISLNLSIRTIDVPKGIIEVETAKKANKIIEWLHQNGYPAAKRIKQKV